jgi:hypothetical protein
VRPPARGVDVQVTLEDHELGSYPLISVVWDGGVADYPDEYIKKAIEAFERFEQPRKFTNNLNYSSSGWR